MMKNKQNNHLVHQYILVVEGKTDQRYINTILKNAYKNIHDNDLNKIRFIKLEGKGNYKKKQSEINNFKKQNVDGENKIIYFIDTDKLNELKHKSDYEKIEKFCSENQYNLVWFNINIEDVFWDEKISRDKKEQYSKKEKQIIASWNKKTMLFSKEKVTIKGSNMFIIFKQLFKAK